MKIWVVLLVLCSVALSASPLWAAEEQPKGAPVSEPALAARADTVWFEDFESSDWREHFRSVGDPAERERMQIPGLPGEMCWKITSKKGEHRSVGASMYFPEGFERLHVRYYLYLPKEFTWGQGQYAHLKLFSQSGRLSGGPWKGYTSAGTRPTGRDKFSCTVAATPKEGEVEFYYYHPDQRGGYGDHKRMNVTLERGRWHSLETMVKVNTVGQKDGEIGCWLDSTKVGEVTGLRFRDTDDLRIRFMGFSNYWGGAGDENTAPVDQTHYIDNIVMATDYVGPAKSTPEGSDGH